MVRRIVLESPAKMIVVQGGTTKVDFGDTVATALTDTVVLAQVARERASHEKLDGEIRDALRPFVGKFVELFSSTDPEFQEANIIISIGR